MKGELVRTMLGGATVLTVAAMGFWGCTEWQGVELEESNSALTTLYNSITQGANETRAGWYDNQPGLDPAIVGSTNFKKLYDITLDAAVASNMVIAQPLVVGNRVLVVTESNHVYLLDANSNTGSVVAKRTLDTPVQSSTLSCGDINPTIGITGTPVVDVSTNTAYFVSKNSTPTVKLYAIDLGSATLADRPGFPVTISGAAQNNAAITFDPLREHQRPGLLLMNGVVYAGFGAHCDVGNYYGWVIGVGAYQKTSPGQILTRWVSLSSTNTKHGDGIWMSGGGLASDQSGDILLSTGNGPNTNGLAYPGPIAGTTPPADFGEAVVRLRLQGDNSLKPIDFFAPFNSGDLNGGDADLGSGTVVLLPSQFGAGTSTTHLAVVAGKGGTLYLLNRDSLGGHKQGSGAGDKVLSSIALGGGTHSRAAAWPGDGGYVYVTVTGGSRLKAFKQGVSGGAANLTSAGQANEDFGAYSGSPIVTSNGTTNGSAIVWAIRHSSELRAYRAVPSGGVLQSLFFASMGSHSKFSSPGVGNGRLFVGTEQGHFIALGTSAVAPVTGGPLDFGKVTVNTTKTLTLAITANQNLSITSIPANGAFTIGTPSPAYGTALTTGQVTNVPVSFKPTATGVFSATLTVNTSQGAGAVTVSGEGQSASASLVASPTQANFGGVVNGANKTIAVSLTNTGSSTLTFAASTAPTSPFSATGIPASGATLAAGASTTVNVTFSPMSTNTYSQTLTINSNGGNVPIALVGTSGTAPTMILTPPASSPINYGALAAGQTKSMSFTLQNTGDLDLEITKSKPPAGGVFVATTTLAEGAKIAGHTTVTETVRFQPTVAGSFTDTWVITGSDTSGVQNVTFNGSATGALTPLPRTGWVGTASNTGGADTPAKAFDGALGTRWSTGAVMVAGMWFQADMGAANTVSQIVMDSNGGADYARAYSVYVSNTAYAGGSTAGLGAAVASGTATASPVAVSFAAKSGRYIAVVLGTIPAGTGSWWSIHEFNAYGSGGRTGTGGAGGGGGAGGAGGSSGGAIKVNSGGPASSPYVADTGFTGGATINHANTIDVTGVTNPAPAAVYQTARVGNFSYTLGGFTASSSHTVRLHMCDTFFAAAGSRRFNVTINGVQVLTSFDIVAASGAKNKAVVQQFTATANGSGQYVIQFANVTDQSLVSGIEIN